jgi:carbon storage regulator
VLVVTRKAGESIRIGDHVLVTVVKVTGAGVRLGVEAPRETSVMRRELQSAVDESTAENPASPCSRSADGSDAGQQVGEGEG